MTARASRSHGRTLFRPNPGSRRCEPWSFERARSFSLCAYRAEKNAEILAFEFLVRETGRTLSLAKRAPSARVGSARVGFAGAGLRGSRGRQKEKGGAWGLCDAASPLILSRIRRCGGRRAGLVAFRRKTCDGGKKNTRRGRRKGSVDGVAGKGEEIYALARPTLRPLRCGCVAHSAVRVARYRCGARARALVVGPSAAHFGAAEGERSEKSKKQKKKGGMGGEHRSGWVGVGTGGLVERRGVERRQTAKRKQRKRRKEEKSEEDQAVEEGKSPVC